MAQAKVSDRPPLAAIVGANVYRLRVLRLPKMSQKALANAAGVALNTVAMVEAARDPSRLQNSVRLDTIEALAGALGVEAAELLAWDEATRVYLDANPSHLKAVAGSGRGGGGQVPLMRAAH